MASDRRVTLGGQIVADKKFPKTYKITDYLLMSISGTLSDAQIDLRLISAQLKLKTLKDKKRPTVRECANFIATNRFQSIRRPSIIPSIVGHLIAGLDEDGSANLYNVGPDGTIKHIEDYDASGSGMLYIWGLLERQWKEGLTVEEGAQLAIDSIKSASARDTASGNGVDVFTITKEGIQHTFAQTAESVYSEEKK